MPTSAASTATIRAWAQAEGLDVAERGRLKPEILSAYAKANGVAVKPKAVPAKRAAPTKSAASKAPARKSAAKTAPKPAAKSVPGPKEVAAVNSSALEVVRVADDSPLADLQDAVAALTARVTRLEAAAAAPAKPKKFGRRG